MADKAITYGASEGFGELTGWESKGTNDSTNKTRAVAMDDKGDEVASNLHDEKQDVSGNYECNNDTNTIPSSIGDLVNSLILTGISLAATFVFLWIIDRDRVISGVQKRPGVVPAAQRRPVVLDVEPTVAPEAEPAPETAGVPKAEPASDAAGAPAAAPAPDVPAEGKPAADSAAPGGLEPAPHPEPVPVMTAAPETAPGMVPVRMMLRSRSMSE